jgi:hypothetical protein
MEGTVQQYSGVVAGEGPPGAVGAVHAGSQPDHDDPRVAIAERRYRPAIILRLIEPHRVKE